MTVKEANFLANALDVMGYNASVYSDYSGRGMFGETTTAVQVQDEFPDVSNAIRKQLAHMDDDELEEGEDYPDPASIRSDSMGLGGIFY
jgi:Pyruvate/2-oxoacid:ferredoxin oxidoreductase gamma subunit